MKITGQFGNVIGAHNLLALVRNTASWVFSDKTIQSAAKKARAKVSKASVKLGAKSASLSASRAAPASSRSAFVATAPAEECIEPSSSAFSFASDSSAASSTPPKRLITLNTHPYAWLDVLSQAETVLPFDVRYPTMEMVEDYFALCMAAHYSTVATFVPTDVDTKIRGVLWQSKPFRSQSALLSSSVAGGVTDVSGGALENEVNLAEQQSEVSEDTPEMRAQRMRMMERESHRRMFEFGLKVKEWDISHISTRWIHMKERNEKTNRMKNLFPTPVSGHDGEWLGVMAGSLGAFVRHRDASYVTASTEAIVKELEREAHAWNVACETPGAELEVLKMAATLTHNAGDLDQGLSFFPEKGGAQYDALRARFGRLGHPSQCVSEEGFVSAFHQASHVYKIVAAEGHRNYPLREVDILRTSRDFLLPLAPCLDDWGRQIGSAAELSFRDKSAVLAGLLMGCKRVKDQSGYYRAIAGLVDGIDATERELESSLATAPRKLWKTPLVQQHLQLSQASFESGLRRRCAAALAQVRRK